MCHDKEVLRWMEEDYLCDSYKVFLWHFCLFPLSNLLKSKNIFQGLWADTIEQKTNIKGLRGEMKFTVTVWTFNIL